MSICVSYLDFPVHHAPRRLPGAAGPVGRAGVASDRAVRAAAAEAAATATVRTAARSKDSFAVLRIQVFFNVQSTKF